MFWAVAQSTGKAESLEECGTVEIRRGSQRLAGGRERGQVGLQRWAALTAVLEGYANGFGHVLLLRSGTWSVSFTALCRVSSRKLGA